MFDVLPFYLAVGILAGLLSGLFGIGGGIVVVPLLAWVFPSQGFPDERIMVMAVATSLAAIVFTSMASVHTHHRLGAVQWDWVGRLTPGLLTGTALGALAGDCLPSAMLKFLYALFLLYVATRMAFGGKPAPRPAGHAGRWCVAGVGLGIGTMSAVLGIGGGTLTVPYLARQGLALKNAVAVSSACGLPIALVGAVVYGWLGWKHSGLPPYSIGYVYLPALVGIAACSAWTAPWGARLAHRLPAERMKRLFAVLLVLVAARFFQQGLDSGAAEEALRRIGAGLNFLSGGH